MCSICFNTEHLTSENAAVIDPGLGDPGTYSSDYINGVMWGGGWSVGPVYYAIEQQELGGGGWFDHQVTAINNAVAAYNNVCNINLTSVAISDPNLDIVFAAVNNSILPGAYGRHEVPDGSPTANPGICVGYYNWELFRPDIDAFDIGGIDYFTLIHELGHGLGLAHPHDTGGGSSTIFPGVTSPRGDYGDNNQNQGIFTTMSYNPGWQTTFPSHIWDGAGGTGDVGYGYQAGPMAFDIAVLQILYGANNSYNTGNNTYYLPTVNGQNQNTYWSCIWDAGGTDTISNVGSSISCKINLNEAPLVGEYAGGYVSWNNNIVGGFTIANGVTIENANGGDGDDDITVNSASNVIDGNGGTDYVFFSGSKAETITSFGFHHNNTSAIVIEGAWGTDTIVDCEYLIFSDEFISVADLIAEYNPALGGSGGQKMFANSTSGEAPYVLASVYSGPVAWIDWEYIANDDGTINVVTGSDDDDFINVKNGTDAVDGGAGDDIIDGGLGSNFLTGGDGTDRFYIDGRVAGTTWSTITDWDNSERLAIWGWEQGVSTREWVENLGADGFKGATLRCDIDGDGTLDLRVTFTGYTSDQIKTPTEFPASDLLWFV